MRVEEDNRLTECFLIICVCTFGKYFESENCTSGLRKMHDENNQKTFSDASLHSLFRNPYFPFPWNFPT